jgi:predicted DsbA family dithiol-disulfide isomerase
LKKNYEIDIHWTAFPLHPNTPEEGLTLEKLFSGRFIDIGEVMAGLKKVADEEGLPFGDRDMTYNSRLAQELGKWAESEGRGESFHDAVFRAYFVEGRNIGKIQELVDVARSVDLSGDEAKVVLEARDFRAAVDSDWSRARSMGVTAVPTFLLDQRFVVGAQQETPWRQIGLSLDRNPDFVLAYIKFWRQSTNLKKEDAMRRL